MFTIPKLVFGGFFGRQAAWDEFSDPMPGRSGSAVLTTDLPQVPREAFEIITSGI